VIRIDGLVVDSKRRPERSRPHLLSIGTLKIRFGEYIGIAGPNGAGKTQLLLALAGLRRVSDGSIVFEGTDAKEPNIGLVFQSPDDQIVGSTVARDLAFGLENRALPPEEIRTRVASALGRCGLADRAAHPPHRLSEGEKQRLALASALILEPDVLLLDEPTSRLDAAGRALFRREIDRVRSELAPTTAGA